MTKRLRFLALHAWAAMGLLALVAAGAQAQAVYTAPVSSTAQPAILCTTRNVYPESGSGFAATSATYRIYQVFPYAVTSPRWYYTNEIPGSFGQNVTAQTASITIKVGIEIGTGAAMVIYPLTFNGGAGSAVIAAGGMVASDPLPITVAAGTKVHVRSFVSAATNGQWGGASDSWPFNGDDSDMVAASVDLSQTISAAGIFGNGFASNNQSGWFGPVACTGTPMTAGPFRCFVGFGDSIFKGAIDQAANNGANPYHGWYQKGIQDRYPYIQCGVSGDAAQNFVAQGNLRKLLGTLSGAKYAVVAYGANDVDINNSTATVLETNLQTMYTALSLAGMRVVACTITPHTDTSNVAVASSNNVRLPVNVWQRGSAPTSVYAKFDIESLVSTVGSGVWSSPSLLADGNHPSNAGHAAIGTGWSNFIASSLPAY